MRTTGWAVSAALTATLALAGCGGAKEGAETGGATGLAAAGGDLDPCGLLTAEEVSAITTDKVSAAEREGDTCLYRSNPEGVRLTAVAADGATRMRAVHAAAGVLGGMGAAVADKGGAGADAANLLKSDATAVPKLGDEAAWGVGATLSVRKGDSFVEVAPPIMHDPATHTGYPLVKDDEKRAIAQKIAAKALARL